MSQQVSHLVLVLEECNDAPRVSVAAAQLAARVFANCMRNLETPTGANLHHKTTALLGQGAPGRVSRSPAEQEAMLKGTWEVVCNEIMDLPMESEVRKGLLEFIGASLLSLGRQQEARMIYTARMASTTGDAVSVNQASGYSKAEAVGKLVLANEKQLLVEIMSTQEAAGPPGSPLAPGPT